MYSGYGITVDGAGLWSFNNDAARNIIIFVVDNSSSSHFDNSKNNFLELSKGPTFGIMEALVHQRKRLVLILVKQTQNSA